MLNRILLKVENIEKMMTKNKNNDTSVLLNQSFLSKFPIDGQDGFLLVENCILNELDFVSKLVNWLLMFCMQMHFFFFLYFCIT